MWTKANARFFISFSQYLGEAPDFLGSGARSLARPIQLGGMHGFFKKLVNNKTKLRQWNSQCFGNISQAVRLAEENLRQYESEFQIRPDVVSKSRLGEARAAFTRALVVEGEFWRQKLAIKCI